MSRVVTVPLSDPPVKCLITDKFHLKDDRRQNPSQHQLGRAWTKDHIKLQMDEWYKQDKAGGVNLILPELTV